MDAFLRWSDAIAVGLALLALAGLSLWLVLRWLMRK